jgi:hypothetical protein
MHGTNIKLTESVSGDNIKIESGVLEIMNTISSQTLVIIQLMFGAAIP